jgi:serine protease Do
MFKRKTIVSSLIAAGLIASGVAGYSLSSLPELVNARAATTTSAPVVPTTAPSPTVALPDFSGLVEHNGPAVVNITATRAGASDAAAQMPGFGRNDPFYEFFRRFQGPMPRQQNPGHALGSGFIVSADGVIFTNAHVVADATEVMVKLTDRREFKAKVIGIDKPTDVAVLKIDARDLPTVRVGDSKNIKVGEWVVAIGSPYGFENSVTSGIVSAKFRALPTETYVPFIQTDVAVNPGNSGGPLFNLKGEVVGINSQIYSSTGGYQGVSFAIPIDVAMKVKDQLQQYGKVSRGRLGVTIQDVNQELASSFGLKQAGGALVSSVEKDSPAARAGLQPGDIIVKVNGNDVVRTGDLSGQVAETKPGNTVRLQVLRQGKSQDIAVTVGELKQQRVAAAGNTGEDHGRLGLALRALTPEEQQQVEAKGGLVVEDASGPAARAGIQPGDVILAINGTPVTSVEQLRSLAAKAGKSVALLVQRDEAKIFIPVPLG